MGLPLAGTHRPGRMHRFTKISGEFAAAQGAGRVVGPYGEISMHSYPVGADDSVRPQDISVLRKSSAKPQLPSGPM